MNSSRLPFGPDTIERLLADTHPYLSCDECFDHLDTFVERMAADPDHLDLPMQVHLSACGACAEEAVTLFELVTSDDA